MMDLELRLNDMPLKITLPEKSLGAFDYMGRDYMERRDIYYESSTQRLYLVKVQKYDA